MAKSFPSYQEILKNLSEAFGPSGHEEDVRSYIADIVKPIVDELREDALGNLIVKIKGKSNKKLMLDAHTDEIGVMVRYIDESGFLRFAKIGGWDDRIFPAHRVKFRSRSGKFYYGVIGMAPPHVLTPEMQSKSLKSDDYFVDIAAVSAADARAKGAEIGDVGVLEYPFVEFAKDYFLGKAFDDRVGCLLLIAALKGISEGKIKTPFTVYGNFATSEEVGLRGAKAAAYAIDPDIALVLEGTVGGDTPGVAPDRRPSSQRGGPVISVIDTSIIVPKKMSDFQLDCAKKVKVPVQVKTPIFGGTNAGSIHLSRAGILTGIISVPCRYIHSPNTTLYWPDFESSLKLVEECVANAHKLLD